MARGDAVRCWRAGLGGTEGRYESELRTPTRRVLVAGLVLLLASLWPSPGVAQAPLRKIGELDLSILGLTATVEPAAPAVPKNTPAGVRIVVRSGERELSLSEVAAVFGAGFEIRGDLSGPGLSRTLALPYTPATFDDPADPDDTLPVHSQPLDPLILPLPGLPVSGAYNLGNLRITAAGQPDLDVAPRQVTLQVVEQVLVTSVKTRQLTLDEIQEKGIVLDADDYVAFEFALGLKLESDVVDLTFPVVFDRDGVPLPQTIAPPPAPARRPPDLPPLPTIVPVLFQVDEDAGGGGPAPKLPPLPSGQGQIKVPSVIVIPGNIGYLKSFFSAQLFVANGTPAGSGLVVDDVTGTIELPPGPDLDPTTLEDNPLALPTLMRDGHEIVQPLTMPVRGLGPDGAPETADDVTALAPGEQGQAEFLLRGEAEGFHTIDFDIRARLDGLATGPIRIRGQASGGVLVRNPFFDVAFTVPGVVRAGERFTVFATLSNIGEGTAQAVFLDTSTLSTSGAEFVGDPPPSIPEIGPGGSATLELEFEAQKTGQVTASYLRFEAGQATGSLKLAVGIGPRGTPLSPDTLVLPAAVDNLPPSVVRAAMSVLGQAWSVAGAPAGTLPSDVVRTSRKVVTEKALALAEAGLRVSLGQSLTDALRDVAFDLWGAGTAERPDLGFDQLLRETEAGLELANAVGAALAQRLSSDPDAPENAFALERAAAEVAVSGPDFVSVAVADASSAAPVNVVLVDGTLRRTALLAGGGELPMADVVGATWLPLGPRGDAPLFGVVPAASSGPYAVELTGLGAGSAQVSATFPRGDGTVARVVTPALTVTQGTTAVLRLDPTRPVLDQDGVVTELSPETITPVGPTLVSATVIGPEVLDGASPFGFHAALVFDRVVDATAAAEPSRYEVPNNGVIGARRQLSGRLVFVNLEQPEGPYVPTELSVLEGITDLRENEGPPATVPLGSLLEDPGAVVSGRVFTADGTPVPSGIVTYANNPDTSCKFPGRTGFSTQELSADGRYELRYVRQDNCGQPFWIMTTDPATGGRREVSARVRAAGETITLDLALLGRGAVTGVVRDLVGDPVPGATVVVVSETDPQIGGSATTDGDGVYFVDGITVGPVVVRAGEGSGLGVQTGRIDRAGTVANVDVTLDGDAVRVSGVVYRDEGEASTPVPGVAVSYKLFTPGNPYGQLLGVAQTDANGLYVFERMPVGAYQVSAALNTRDRAVASGTATYPPPDPGGFHADIHIVIPPEEEFATVEGTVFLPDGTPASDVVVSVGGRGVLSVDGAYSIPGVRVQGNSERVTAATRDGRRSGSNTVVVTAAQVYGGVDITLSGLGTAAFAVFDEAGEAVGAGQEVTLLGSCGNPCGCKAAVTDADGVVRFEGLSLGRVTAQAFRSGATFADVARGSVTLFQDDATVYGSLRFAGIGSVSGMATGPDGPVHGAEITLVSNRFDYNSCSLARGVSHRVLTGTSGDYRFDGVNLGPVSVSATHDWAGTAGASGTLVTPGQELVLDVEFQDNIAGELSGTVYLPDGVTPAGAGVEVTGNGPLPDVMVRTDGNGDYRFATILPRGSWTLTARDPLSGGVARSRVVLAVDQDVEHDVRLLGRGTVRVTVVDGADQPLDAAQLTLKESQYPQRSFEASLRPGDDGVATFENVYEGPFTVNVTDAFARGGGASGTLPGPGATVEVKVSVTKTGVVRGRFLMPDQTPIPFGTVTLFSGGRAIGQTTTAGAGPEVGSFAFAYVPVGSVKVEAEDPLTARTGFQVGSLEDEGDELVLDVVAQGLGRVHGRVTLNEEAQGLVDVTIVSGDYRASTMTSGDGTYSVEGVPEGHVTVTASFPGGFLAGTASATLEGDGGQVEIDVALREAGSIVGYVWKAGTDEEPAPASVVKLYVGGPGGGSQQTTTRPEDGFFEFSRVPAGKASITVDVLSGIDRASQTVEVGPAQLVPVEIFLQGVGSIRGQAVASEAPDAPGVAGWLTFSGTAFPTRRTIETGDDGLFELPEVLAGEFTVSLRQGTGPLALYGTATGVVLPDTETTVRVELQPSATVTGTVLRPSGDGGATRPAFGAEVTLDVRIGLNTGGQLTVQVQDDGSFEARGVPHGELTVTVYDPISQGRARLTPQPLGSDVLDLGTIVLDTGPPALAFIEPADGTVRAALGGPIVLELTDEDSGIDPGTLTVTYNDQGTQGSASFEFDGLQATGLLQPQSLVIGENRLRARVEDLAGLIGEVETTLHVTGASVSGCVLAADGSQAAGIQVTLDSKVLTQTDAEGCYAFPGQKPGSHTVRATDPETGLQAQDSDQMLDGVDLELPDIHLPASARLTGTVRRHGPGALAAGVEVKVGTRTAVTDVNGVFDLNHFALGTYTVKAFSPDGDQGEGEAILVTPGTTVNVPIVLNGVGAVEVTVVDANDGVVADASVHVVSSSSFGGNYYASTGSAGEPAVFPTVLYGSLTVTATYDGLHGEEVRLLDTGSIAVTVHLESAGRVAGKAAHQDGDPAVGVTVNLRGSKSATTVTSSGGDFTFENVPLGDFTLELTGPDGDRGAGSGTVGAAGETASVSVTMNGVGTVTVTVRDALGALVEGANVSLSSGTSYGLSYSGQKTDDNGLAVYENVLAGPVTAKATLWANGTQGFTEGTLEIDGALNLEISLEPVGTITGRVLAANGGGPVAGVQVQAGTQSTVSDAEGGFALSDLTYGTYNLVARVDGRTRARREGIELSEADPLAEGQDLVLVSTSVVTGTITAPTGEPAEGAAITLHSRNTTYGGYFHTTADSLGVFSVADVPVGEFTIAASLGPDQANAAGTVPPTGEAVEVNLQLLSSAVKLPVTLKDGNTMSWKIHPSGAVDQAFHLNGETPRLRVLRDGVLHEFTGPACPASGDCTTATEENKREVVLVQDGMAGLVATRKVFVAWDGYFVRYLDLLHNPGTETVTVDVVEDVDFGGTEFAQTSSGDAVVSGDDIWVVLDDDDDTDVFDTSSPYWAVPPTAFVASGPGGVPATTVELTEDGSRGVLTRRWDAVAIAPGATVGFLQVLSAQSSRDRAVGSAERLSQLPPELLVGLAAEEGGVLYNVDVPEGMQSSLPPLHNDGVVLGQVLGGDAETPIASASLRLRSRSLHYGRPLAFNAGADGRFISPAPTASDPKLVPREAFDLTASRNSTLGNVSYTEAGDFPDEGLIDLTSVVDRSVYASSSSAYAAVENAVDGDLSTYWQSATDDAASRGGTPFYEVVLPGDAVVRRVALRGRSGGTSAIHQVLVELRDATGAVLWSTELSLSDGDGAVTLPSDVPGLDRGRSVRITSLLDFTRTVAVAEIQLIGEADLGRTGRAETDIVLRGSGVVRGEVLRSDGSAIVGGNVKLQAGTSSQQLSLSNRSQFLFAPVPPGTYSVTATHPLGWDSVTVDDLAVPASCEEGPGGLVCPAVEVDIVYPAFGAVKGTVQTAAGGFTGAWAHLGAAGFTRSKSVSSTTGAYEFEDVPPGDYTLTVTDNRSYGEVIREVTVVAGLPATEDITLWPVGQARVTATVAGQALEGGIIAWQADSRGADWIGVSSKTSATGAVTIPNVPGPTFRVRVTHPDQSKAFGVAEASLTQEGEDVEVEVEVPGLGEVAGVLRSRDGTPLTEGEVSIWHATDASELGSAISDPATGEFLVTKVPVGPVRVRGELQLIYGGSYAWSRAEVDAVLPSDGARLEHDALGAFGAFVEPGQWDLWQLRATAGEDIGGLVIGAGSGGHPALEDPQLDVFGPDGTLVASNDNRSGADLNAEASFTAPEDGLYTFAAHASGPGTGGYHVASRSNADSHVFRPYEPPAAVTGTLRLGGLLEAEHSIRLVIDGTPVFTTHTGTAGTFSLPVLTPGPVTVEAVDGEGVPIARQEADTAGGTAQADLEAPARVAVTVRVTQIGMAVPDATVTIESDNVEALPEDARRERTTSSGGEAETIMPIGRIRATVVRDGFSHIVEEDATGSTLTLDLVLPLTPATVSGTVTGGGGSTGVPGASVELLGFGTTTTDATGGYRFDVVPAGSYTVVASLGGAKAQLPVVQDGSDVVADLALPISILRGLVTGGKGAEVIVEACATDTAGAYVCVTTTTDEDGNYGFFGLPDWRYGSVWVEATPPGALVYDRDYFSYSGSTQIRTYTMYLSLPSTGSIVGRVYGGAPPVTVELICFYSCSTPRSTTAAPDGSFRFDHVYPRTGSVLARDSEGIPADGVEVTAVANEETEVELWIRPSATLEISLVDESGAPLAGTVDIEAPEAPSASYYTGTWTRSVDLFDDQTGEPLPATVRVPAGLFRAISGDRPNPGAADGVLEAGGVTSVTLQRGSHVELPERIEGSQASYVANSREWCNEPCGRFIHSSLPTSDAYAPFVRPEMQGRAFSSLHVAAGNVRIRRQHFVPESGEFARMLTVITNPTSVTASVSLGSDFDHQGVDWADLIDEAQPDGVFDGDDSWAAYQTSEGLIHAFSVGDHLRPDSAVFNTGGGEGGSYIGWAWGHTLEIPPGEARAFLTFTAARTDGNQTALLETIRSLADLTAPGALAGLTFEEREAIVNFALPTLGDVEGVVTLPGGDVVPGARVGVVDTDGGLLGEATTDAEGTFTISAVNPGTHSIVAVDPLTGRPGRAQVEVVAGPPITTSITIAGPSDLGGVRVVGTIADGGAPAEGAVVALWADGYSPVWAPSAVLDASGEFLFNEVPPGPVEARWAPPYGGDAVVVSVSPGLTETAALSATQQPVFLPMDLTGDDGIPYLAEGNGQVTLGEGCLPFCGTVASLEDEREEFWQEYPWVSEGASVNGGREVALGPHALVVEGLRATRRVFVPASGRFARILDVLHNPRSSDVTFCLELSGQLLSSGADWTIQTSSGDATFDVTDDYAVFSADGTRVVGFVTAGATGTQKPTRLFESLGTPWSSFLSGWNALSVPSGGTVIVMQFVVVREPGETAAAAQQAAALADLTDPEALAGVSAAERALIVNFEVP